MLNLVSQKDQEASLVPVNQLKYPAPAVDPDTKMLVPASLTDHEREICRMTVCGYTPATIAAKFNCFHSRIKEILLKPDCQSFMAYLREGRDVQAADVSRKLKDMAPLAVDKYEQVLARPLDDPTVDPKTQLRAAGDILDRSGHPRMRGLVYSGNESSAKKILAQIKENFDKALQDPVLKKSLGVTAEIESPPEENPDEEIIAVHADADAGSVRKSRPRVKRNRRTVKPRKSRK